MHLYLSYNIKPFPSVIEDCPSSNLIFHKHISGKEIPRQNARGSEILLLYPLALETDLPRSMYHWKIENDGQSREDREFFLLKFYGEEERHLSGTSWSNPFFLFVMGFLHPLEATQPFISRENLARFSLIESSLQVRTSKVLRKSSQTP